MAAHRGNDERLEPVGNPVLDDVPDDGGDVRDASTADADANAAAWTNAGRKSTAFELAPRLAADVCEPMVRKTLAHEK